MNRPCRLNSSVRHALGDVHLAYLRSHRSEVHISGGLRQEAGGAFICGLWAFEVPSRERAVQKNGI